MPLTNETEVEQVKRWISTCMDEGYARRMGATQPEQDANPSLKFPVKSQGENCPDKALYFADGIRMIERGYNLNSSPHHADIRTLLDMGGINIALLSKVRRDNGAFAEMHACDKMNEENVIGLTLKKNDILLHACIEMLTGVYRLSRPAFKTLQEWQPTSDRYSDSYRFIIDTRPIGALKHCSYEQFLMLTEQVRKEKHLPRTIGHSELDTVKVEKDAWQMIGANLEAGEDRAYKSIEELLMFYEELSDKAWGNEAAYCFDAVEMGAFCAMLNKAAEADKTNVFLKNAKVLSAPFNKGHSSGIMC